MIEIGLLVLVKIFVKIFSEFYSFDIISPWGRVFPFI
jgi:hypothetical protein